MDELSVLREKDRRRKESIDRSKQRPEYKEKTKGYNKKYYEQRKKKLLEEPLKPT